MTGARQAAADTTIGGIRLLALGDSYTIGEGVTADERWPSRLVAMMHARGFPMEAPAIIARTGWTTDELSTALDAAKLGGSFDLVTLQIGVNDQYRERCAEDYRTGFRQLLSRAIGLAGTRRDRVIVVSIPDWGVTPFAARDDTRSKRDQIAGEIDAFNAINRAEAAGAGARYVNVTAVSRRAAGEPELLADDGLHPSPAMHAEWARLVLPQAVEAIGGRPPTADR
jgi:lysophospholipase L1-like esterase